MASWSRLGFAARRRLWSWADDERPTMEGRVVLVTGGTSGIGRAMVVALARAGATVGLVGRDEARVSRAVEDLRTEAGSTRLFGQPADLGSLSSVRALADGVAQTDRPVGCPGPRGRRLEPRADHDRRRAGGDGGRPRGRALPLDVPAGALAPASGARPGGVGVVRRHVHPPTGRRAARSAVDPVPGDRRLRQAKRAQVALARQWDQRWPGPECCPMRCTRAGWTPTPCEPACRSSRPCWARCLRRAEQGADTAVWLADGSAGPDAPATFWLDRRARPDHRWPGPPDPPGEPARLWEWCRRRAGLNEPVGGDR